VKLQQDRRSSKREPTGTYGALGEQKVTMLSAPTKERSGKNGTVFTGRIKRGDGTGGTMRNEGEKSWKREESSDQ